MKFFSYWTWRNINAVGALSSAVIWAVATETNWISSVKFISHISMITMIFTFIAAWRADVPTKKEKGGKK